MKYGKETLRKILAVLGALSEMYMSMRYEDLKLHISTGNRKIGRTHNFSMAPGYTCANCSECINYCYDIKACWQYENVRKARAENTALMRKNLPATMMLINNYISKRRAHKYFRWHVSGDILNVEYFDWMVRIARWHPDWIFWTYTKNYYAVNEWVKQHGGTKKSVPSNLSVMFSVWNGMECPNPYGFATFTCIMEGMTPAPDSWACPGNCDACLRSGHGCPFQESSHVNAH